MMALSLSCAFMPKAKVFDAPLACSLVIFICIYNVRQIVDFYQVLTMKTGRDNQVNTVKGEIQKISLIKEVDSISII